MLAIRTCVSALKESQLRSSACKIRHHYRSQSRAKEGIAYCNWVWQYLHNYILKDAMNWCTSACLLLVENPICRHTTAASLLSQPSSHTVPHLPDMNTSTRPSQKCRPSMSLRFPFPWPPKLICSLIATFSSLPPSLSPVFNLSTPSLSLSLCISNKDLRWQKQHFKPCYQ